MGEFTLPVLSGGTFFGAETPDVLGRIDEWNWFVVSDVAGLLKGLTAGVRYDVLVGIGLFAASVFLLWHTRFGLRLRSAGEHPSAADSLGVRVHLYRYHGAAISGALAGLGGAMLVIASGRYSQGQTVGKGFLGLATLVVGNWRPVGVAIGASIFGFFDGITQRLSPDQLVLALLLAAALLLFAGTAYAIVTDRGTAWKLVAVGVCAFGVFVVLRAFFYELGDTVALFLVWLVVGLAITTAGTIAASRYGGLAAAITAMAAVAALFVYLRLDQIPDEFVPMLPYIVTLVVVASRGQALRPPAQAGEPWFKGQQT
jgi:simple sugar transport system permease protein